MWELIVSVSDHCLSFFTFHHKQIIMARRARINATSIRQLIGAIIIILKLQ